MKRFDRLYLDDIMEEVGMMFAKATRLGYILPDFITFYLNSPLQEAIETGMPVYLTMLGHELLDELKKDGLDSHVKRTKDFQDALLAEWIGNFYTLLQWQEGITGKKCAKKYPPEDVIRWSYRLSELDLSLAIERYTGKYFN